MEKIVRLLEKIKKRHIDQDDDAVVLIVGDEGGGKSTLILQLIYLWMQLCNRTPTIENVLNRIVWNDREELRTKWGESEKKQAIGVPDASRVMHRKEVMKGEQVELEKDLYDIRSMQFVQLLGFQNPQSVPGDLAERRATTVLYLPSRGTIHGYSPNSLTGMTWESRPDWPTPDLRDSFKSLDGTELWDTYSRVDDEKKQERWGADEEQNQKKIVQDVVEAIRDDVEYYVSVHQREGTFYLDIDMILFDHDHLTERQARQARKIIERDDTIKIEDYRVVQDGETLREKDPDDNETGTEETENANRLSLDEIEERVYQDLSEYLGEDGRSGDYMIDHDVIGWEWDLGSQKARQVRKAVERRDAVTVSPNVVKRGDEIIAKKD